MGRQRHSPYDLLVKQQQVWDDYDERDAADYAAVEYARNQLAYTDVEQEQGIPLEQQPPMEIPVYMGPDYAGPICCASCNTTQSAIWVQGWIISVRIDEATQEEVPDYANLCQWCGDQYAADPVGFLQNTVPVPFHDIAMEDDGTIHLSDYHASMQVDHAYSNLHTHGMEDADYIGNGAMGHSSRHYAADDDMQTGHQGKGRPHRKRRPPAQMDEYTDVLPRGTRAPLIVPNRSVPNEKQKDTAVKVHPHHQAVLTQGSRRSSKAAQHRETAENHSDAPSSWFGMGHLPGSRKQGPRMRKVTKSGNGFAVTAQRLGLHSTLLEMPKMDEHMAAELINGLKTTPQVPLPQALSQQQLEQSAPMQPSMPLGLPINMPALQKQEQLPALNGLPMPLLPPMSGGSVFAGSMLGQPSSLRASQPAAMANKTANKTAVSGLKSNGSGPGPREIPIVANQTLIVPDGLARRHFPMAFEQHQSCYVRMVYMSGPNYLMSSQEWVQLLEHPVTKQVRVEGASLTPIFGKVMVGWKAIDPERGPMPYPGIDNQGLMWQDPTSGRRLPLSTDKVLVLEVRDADHDSTAARNLQPPQAVGMGSENKRMRLSHDGQATADTDMNRTVAKITADLTGDPSSSKQVKENGFSKSIQSARSEPRSTNGSGDQAKQYGHSADQGYGSDTSHAQKTLPYKAGRDAQMVNRDLLLQQHVLRTQQQQRSKSGGSPVNSTAVANSSQADVAAKPANNDTANNIAPGQHNSSIPTVLSSHASVPVLHSASRPAVSHCTEAIAPTRVRNHIAIGPAREPCNKAAPAVEIEKGLGVARSAADARNNLLRFLGSVECPSNGNSADQAQPAQTAPTHIDMANGKVQQVASKALSAQRVSPAVSIETPSISTPLDKPDLLPKQSRTPNDLITEPNTKLLPVTSAAVATGAKAAVPSSHASTKGTEQPLPERRSHHGDSLQQSQQPMETGQQHHDLVVPATTASEVAVPPVVSPNTANTATAKSETPNSSSTDHAPHMGASHAASQATNSNPAVQTRSSAETATNDQLELQGSLLDALRPLVMGLRTHGGPLTSDVWVAIDKMAIEQMRGFLRHGLPWLNSLWEEKQYEECGRLLRQMLKMV